MKRGPRRIASVCAILIAWSLACAACDSLIGLDPPMRIAADARADATSEIASDAAGAMSSRDGEAGGPMADGSTSRGEAGVGGDAGCPVGSPACAAVGVPCCQGGVCGEGLACRGGFCETAPPANTGASCTADDECPSGICQAIVSNVLPVGSLRECTTACTSSADCVRGWTCGSVAGRSGNVCQCTLAASNLCDGTDSDCDGVVDDEPLADESCQGNAGEVCQAGACTCVLTCAGTCVDPRSDPGNCGGCGVTCAVGTQTCVDGACACLDGAASCTMTALATGQNSPLSVAVYGGTVFWVNAGDDSTTTENGSVMSVAEDGGAPLTLAAAQYSPSFIVADATGVYWSTAGGSVLRATLDGGAPVTIATGYSDMQNVAVDDARVYWANGSAIFAAPKDSVGDAGVITLEPDANAQRIAIDTANVYWVSTVSGTLMKASLDGGAPVILGAVPAESSLGTVDSTNAYVVVDPSFPVLTGSVLAYPLDGGGPVILATNLEAPNSGVVSDGTTIYFTTGGTGSDVVLMKTAIACPVPVTIATGQTGSYNQPLALDGETLYFVASGSPTFGDDDGVVAKISPR